MRILAQSPDRIRVLHDGHASEFTTEQWNRITAIAQRGPISAENVVMQLYWNTTYDNDVDQELTRLEAWINRV